MVSRIDITQPQTGNDQPVKVIRDNFVEAHIEISALQEITTTLQNNKLDMINGLTGSPLRFHRVTPTQISDDNIDPKPADYRGGLVFVGPETGGGALYYSNGTEWRQLLDNTFTGGSGGSGSGDGFTNIRADIGAVNSASYSSVEIVGGSGISTAIIDNILTIENTNPIIDVFTSVQTDGGSISASTSNDTLRVTGGKDITISVANQQIVVEFTGTSGSIDGLGGVNTAGAVEGSVLKYQSGIWAIASDLDTQQNVYDRISGDSGSSIAASINSQIQFIGGIDITTAVTGNTVTFDYSGSAEVNQFAYSIVSDGIDQIQATSKTDALEFFGGNGIAVSADTGNNRIQIDYTGSNALSELTDVDLTGLSQDSILRYDMVSNRWLVSTSASSAQNLFETFNSDNGTITAASENDALNIQGGTGIETSIVGNTLTINNTISYISPNIWSEIHADSGLTVADSTADILLVSGGFGISTAVVGDTLTITNDSPNVDQNLFHTVIGDTGSITANTATDTLTVVGTNGISTAVVGNTLTIDYGGSPSATNLGNLNDVVLSTLSADQILRYDGMHWINSEDLPNWSNIVADSGSTTATSVGSTLVIEGGDGIVTEIVDDVLTITNNFPDQNVYVTMTANAGSATASSPNDNFSILGASGISTEIVGNNLTIRNTAPNVDQNLFRTIASGAGVRTAGSPTDTFTILGTNGITTSISGGILTIDNSVISLEALNDVDISGAALNDILRWNGASWVASADYDNQNLWLTFVADTGSVSADTTSDVLTISGGTGIITEITADTLTITNSAPNVIQNTFTSISADLGNIEATTPTGSVSIQGGTGISTSIDGNTITITNDEPNIAQNAYTTLITQNGVESASSPTDSLSVFGGTGITTSLAGGTLTIDNTSPTIARLIGDTGSYNVSAVGEDLTLSGGTGISTVVSAGTLTINNDALVFSNIVADFGTAMADDISDTLTILGGDNVTTTISTGNTLVIDVDTNPTIDRLIGDTGSYTVSAVGEDITFTGSTGITTTVTSNTVTVALDPDQTFDTVTANTVTADTFTSAGTGIQTIQSATDIVLDAPDSVRVAQSPFRLASFTTTERDELTPSNGDMIYNTTLHRFQGYANGAWVDLNT